MRDGRKTESGTGKQDAASVGQRIQQGDEGKIANSQEADSRVDDEGLERGDETVVHVEGRSFVAAVGIDRHERR